MGLMKNKGGMIGGNEEEPAEFLTKEESAKYENKKRMEDYHYEAKVEEPEKKSGLQMDGERYEEKKKEYDDKMKKFREKKKLSEKDLEKNL